MTIDFLLSETLPNSLCEFGQKIRAQLFRNSKSLKRGRAGIDPEKPLGVQSQDYPSAAEMLICGPAGRKDFCFVAKGCAMRPLSLEDLIPLNEFQARRKEYLSNHLRYIETYRKVRIGTRAVLVFENRQTLWFRVQDVLHLARIHDENLQRQELDLHNSILPLDGGLQGALLLDSHLPPGDPASSTWNDLRGDHLQLMLGDKRAISANLLSTRPEDRCWGTAHWVHFRLDEQEKRWLADGREQVSLRLRTGGYEGQSPPLPDAVRSSLMEDLTSFQKAA